MAIVDRSISTSPTASTDDAVIYNGSLISLTGADLNCGDLNASFYDMSAGMRFENITIDLAAGDVINSAVLKVIASQGDSNLTLTSTLAGEAADNSATFTSVYAAFVGRPLTTATVAWNPVAFTSSNPYDSPDITTILTEILSRPGWVSGNAVTIFWTQGTAAGWGGTRIHRSIASENHATSAAPRLYIDYTPAGSGGGSDTIIAGLHGIDDGFGPLKAARLNGVLS